jgi:hypothetical protein
LTIKNEDAMKKRADNLKSKNLNGLKFILVKDMDVSQSNAHIELHFFNDNELLNIWNEFDSVPGIFQISGGHRIPAQNNIKVIEISKPTDTFLKLTVNPIGDYSTYTFKVDYQNIDPFFSKLDFKFRPGCFNINCKPEREPSPAPGEEPDIDYLAKDYDSFKHTMIAAMMARVPGWQPTSEADLDQVIIELLSAAADELSDYQDRVMNEAYLASARKRVSLARHARLMDYHIHEGNQASTWLALKVASRGGFDLSDDFSVWAGEGTVSSSSSVFMSREKKQLIFSMGLEFQNDLDSSNFTNNLRSKFESFGITLSSSVSIKVTGSEWLVSDDTLKTYAVRKEGNKLKVYAPYILHPLVNQMGLYTWDNSIPALEAGANEADLLLLGENNNNLYEITDNASALIVQDLIRSGKIKYLLIQEYLNPKTGQELGRNPAKRQLLKLIPEEAKADFDPVTETTPGDPLTATWFVRVRWEEKDRLKSNYCFTVICKDGNVNNVSLFHGNLVEVYHGRSMKSVFKEPEPIKNPGEYYFERLKKWSKEIEDYTDGWTICRLPESPLAYENTLPGGETSPISTLEVKVKMPKSSIDPWDEKISLVHSDDSDEYGDHFMVETDEDGKSLIRFGNGINGKKIPSNAEVHCSYQIGRGLEGNIGRDKLTNFDTNIFSEIKSCWNPFDITDGRDPEPAADVIRRAPEAYRYRQLRAVTLKDYEDRAQDIPEVSRAKASYAWTGSWRSVRIAIDPVGTTELKAEVRDKIMRKLEAVRLIGEDLEIRPPGFIPLEILVTLCIHADYWQEDIKYILEQEFSKGYMPDGRMAFFHPDRWTFGQELRASQIIGRVQSIEGVDHVVNVSMKRWNEVTPGTASVIELRTNEIILVRNDPDHMEKGFIFFDIRGGRK